ncbi:MAG: DNA-processing protein DprA [Balneolia bacterium]|nr:DNA-processing protein DprA [Balneolia bacterium]
MNHDEIKIHIALSLVHGLGAGRIIRLMQEFPNAEDVFRASEKQIREIPGFGKTIASNILKFRDWKRVDEILSVTENTDAWLLSINDEKYPSRLRHIYDPPLIIWGRGEVDALSRQGIAIIGTRKPTAYGRDKASSFAGRLAKTGLSIISGLAYGVDTLAHTAAVENNGCTVAVLGSGIDKIYPASNKRLTDEIINKGGAVISEFVPGTKPDRENFPTRNRVVSGLSLGVLVVESDVTGGSMITAYSALDQGREVFAIPHDITTQTGKGCNTMIKKGHAKLTMNVDDILEELNLDWSVLELPEEDPELQKELFGEEGEGKGVTHPKRKVSEAPKKNWRSKEDLTEEMKQVCELLEAGEMHIDDLADKAAKPGHLLLGTLLDLELQELVVAKSGKRFSLA